jgi:hypothetical protein
MPQLGLDLATGAHGFVHFRVAGADGRRVAGDIHFGRQTAKNAIGELARCVRLRLAYLDDRELVAALFILP